MIVILWLVLAIVVGMYAHSKQTKGGFLLAFILSAIFSPLIGGIAVALSPADEKRLLKKGGMKKCPACAEMVKQEAVVCRYCKHQFITTKV